MKITNLKEFKALMDLNPNYKSYNSNALANKLNIDVKSVIDWREALKSKSFTIEIKETINLEDTPTIEDLELTGYAIETKIPQAPKGYIANSFKVDRNGNIADTWYKLEDSSESISSINWSEITQELKNNIHPLYFNFDIDSV